MPFHGTGKGQQCLSSVGLIKHLGRTGAEKVLTKRPGLIAKRDRSRTRFSCEASEFGKADSNCLAGQFGSFEVQPFEGADFGYYELELCQSGTCYCDSIERASPDCSSSYFG